MEVIVQRAPDYLEHHGILKQKWGVRHGPPYPLDYNDHSPAQKKANGKKALDNYENNNPTRQTRDLNKSYKKIKRTGEAIQQHRKNLNSLNNKYKNPRVLESYINQENAIYKKKLLDIETSERNKAITKKILLGVGATAVVGLTAYSLYKANNLSTVTPSVPPPIPNLSFTSPVTPSVPPPIPNSALSGTSSQTTKQWLSSLQSKGKFGEAQLFTNGYDGNIHNTQHLFDQRQWESLSASERKGIFNYTQNNYAPMNKILRGLSPRNSKYGSMIDHCTAGLEKMRLPEDTLCHRGVGSLSSLAKTLGVTESDLKNPSVLSGMVSNGFTYTDPAFFSSGGSMSDAWGGTKIHAFAPKGTKGMYVDPISAFKGEHEILLQRNTSFKVTDFKLGPDGSVTDLFVEVVEQIL